MDTPARRREASVAFTLIELLIVIAIIAIRAAILFPVFARARAKARQAKCLSGHRQLGLAFQMYMDDWEGFFPKRENVNDWATRGGWPFAIQPYVKSAQLFRCPSDTTPYSKAAWQGTAIEEVSYFTNGQIVKTAPPRHEAELDDTSGILLLVEAGARGELRGAGDLNGPPYPCSQHQRAGRAQPQRRHEHPVLRRARQVDELPDRRRRAEPVAAGLAVAGALTRGATPAFPRPRPFRPASRRRA